MIEKKLDKYLTEQESLNEGMKLIKLGNNMHELVSWGKRLLFSYETPVASFEHGQYYVTKKHYSSTTTQQINQ
jgi:hypothetical protein